MSSRKQTRRQFVKTSAALAAGASAPYWFTARRAEAFKFDEKNDRPVVGSIGLGGRGRGIARQARALGDIVAVCDVDKKRVEQGRKELSGGKADTYGDYRKLLERKDIDVVTIGTPDHWHSKIAIEAMQAGKDVYCEKPLTLTIEEGKLIRQTVKDTGRVFQVGTQQRSEYGQMFLKAVALAQSGRLGKIQRVTCAIGGAPTSGPLKTEPVPPHLDWETWLGQTPLVEYIPRRCHYEFRWWYEYSGGKMTDWGAHHVDIAQWAIGMEEGGPTAIEPVEAKHPVPFEDGYPTADNQYNCATQFNVRCAFPGGVEMFIRHNAPDLGFGNGIMIEGSEGRIFVNRGKLTGEAVEQLKENPLPEDALTKLYKGKQPGNHMRNFFECVKDRGTPVSDVFTHHRVLTTCHLANIALRLGRSLKWDAKTEQVLGDEEANGWQSREQREGYEIKV